MPGVDKAIDSADLVPKRFRATNLASSALMRLIPGRRIDDAELLEAPIELHDR
jgi:hypothetical protein